MLCENAFRMELDAPDLVLAVPDRHDDAVFGAGADLELRGEVLLGDRQGVVAAGEETIGELFEQALSIVRILEALP